MKDYKKIFIILLFVSFTGCSSSSSPQLDSEEFLQQLEIIVETLAGSGFRCLVNGPAQTAEFDGPTSIATNEDGHIVVTDTNNNLVRIFNTKQNSVTTYQMYDKAVSGKGCENSDIPDFVFTTASANTTANSLSRLNQPTGIAVDADGNMFIADRSNHVIRKVTPEGKLLILAGTGQPGFENGPGNLAQFNFPANVSVDKQGNILVADQANHLIRIILPTGETSTLAGNGNPGFADGSAEEAMFTGPTDAVMAEDGRIFVADRENHRIRVIHPSGEVTTLAGSGVAGFVDGLGGAARFNLPTGLAIDAGNNIIVADFGNHRIRQVNSEGEVSTLAGNGKAGFANGTGDVAQFNSPTDVLVDQDGKIVVADFANHRIRGIEIIKD